MENLQEKILIVDDEIYMEVDEKNGQILELKPCNIYSDELEGDEISRYLVREVDNSYYQMKKQKIEDSRFVHNECELKLKVSENVKEYIKKYCNIKDCKYINQRYLDLKNEKTIEFVQSFLPGSVDISVFSEARIRKIKNEKCYLTLKSTGYMERFEYEIEIPFCIAENLDKNVVKGLINKARYDIIHHKGITISIDVYLDRKLYIAEVEFDKSKYTEKEIVEIVKNELSDCEIENVTSNIGYKNSNLAK